MSRGLRSLLLVLVVSILGAAPGAVADAGAESSGGIDVVVDDGTGASGPGSDLATPGSMVRGTDIAAIDAGSTRSDRLDHRGGQVLAVALGGVPAVVVAALGHFVEPMTTAHERGQRRECEGRAPPVDLS